MTEATRVPGPKPRRVSEVTGDKWRAENREAITAHNRRVAESGSFLVPDWIDDGGVRKDEPWLQNQA